MLGNKLIVVVVVVGIVMVGIIVVCKQMKTSLGKELTTEHARSHTKIGFTLKPSLETV